MNYEEEVRKILKESTESMNNDLENAIIKFFGSPEEALKRMQMYVFELTPITVKATEYGNDDKVMYSFHEEMRIRLKTEEELQRDRVNEILRARVPLAQCIVCHNDIYQREVDVHDAYKTRHGWIHRSCEGGRSTDDPNHY